jgi:hypothetical protein
MTHQKMFAATRKLQLSFNPLRFPLSALLLPFKTRMLPDQEKDLCSVVCNTFDVLCHVHETCRTPEKEIMNVHSETAKPTKPQGMADLSQTLSKRARCLPREGDTALKSAKQEK